MLRIRLTRTGKRHQPHYRIVVAEHTAPVKGKFIESLGHYNPRSKELVVNSEQTTAWLNKGAQPSNTVARLLTKSGMAHKLIVVHTFPERPSKKAQAEGPAAEIATPEVAAETETPTEDTATPEVDAPEATTPTEDPADPAEAKAE